MSRNWAASIISDPPFPPLEILIAPTTVRDDIIAAMLNNALRLELTVDSSEFVFHPWGFGKAVEPVFSYCGLQQ